MILSVSKIKTIFKCIPCNYKKKMYPLFFLNLINVLLDLLSVALLLPFLMLIFNPNLSYNNKILNLLFNPKTVYLSLFLLILFFITKNILSVKIINYQSKLIYNISSEISKKYITNFIKKGYLNYQNKEKGDVLRNTIDIPNGFVNYILMSLVIIFTEMIVILFIAIFSFIFFAKFSIYIILIVFSVIGLFSYYRKKKLNTVNNKLKNGYNTNANYLLDIINGYLNIKSISKESFFLKQFNDSNKKLNTVYGYLTAIRISNNKFIEIIIIITICFLVVYLLNFSSSSDTNSLFLVSFLASISIKLLPSLNKLFISFSNLKAYDYSINIILNYLKREEKIVENKLPVVFNKKIIIKNISFKYSNIKLLENINLEILKGEMIGIKGRTGSGKTTLIHVLLRLIKPASGTIYFDEEIARSDDNWIKHFGYVSQQMHIYNGSILNNIAIGECKKDIDFIKIDALIKAFNFENDLMNFSEGIYTNTGNNGQLLSGGQKQKIALIRSLYFNPKILILDEATNQLDIENEILILNYIKKLSKNNELTVILISHNNKALNYCDRILELKNNSLNET